VPACAKRSMMNQVEASYILNESAPAKVKKIVRQAIGYLLALACLYWVFYDIHFQSLWQSLPGINWWLVVLAVICDILSYVCQGLRWQQLLHTAGTITTLRATQAVYAGLFVNEILPMRIGELVRTYLVSRWLSVKFISIIPSVAIERFFDAIWLATGIIITALFVQLPKDFRNAANMLVIALVILVALFLYLLVLRRKNGSTAKEKIVAGWHPLRKLRSFIITIADGIRDIGASRLFYFSLIVSGFILIFQIIAFWLVMEAYGLNLSVWTGAAVLLLLHLGTIIPNAPSNIGTYQFFCVVGLTFFGVDKTVATGFSVVVFIILTIPLWAIGLVAIGRNGMTVKQLRNEIKGIMKKSYPL
jgi:uncharacterized protein (TIRG00374 family)